MAACRIALSTCGTKLEVSAEIRNFIHMRNSAQRPERLKVATDVLVQSQQSRIFWSADGKVHKILRQTRNMQRRGGTTACRIHPICAHTPTNFLLAAKFLASRSQRCHTTKVSSMTSPANKHSNELLFSLAIKERAQSLHVLP